MFTFRLYIIFQLLIHSVALEWFKVNIKWQVRGVQHVEFCVCSRNAFNMLFIGGWQSWQSNATRPLLMALMVIFSVSSWLQTVIIHANVRQKSQISCLTYDKLPEPAAKSICNACIFFLFPSPCCSLHYPKFDDCYEKISLVDPEIANNYQMQ